LRASLQALAPPQETLSLARHFSSAPSRSQQTSPPHPQATQQAPQDCCTETAPPSQAALSAPQAEKAQAKDVPQENLPKKDLPSDTNHASRGTHKKLSSLDP